MYRIWFLLAKGIKDLTLNKWEQLLTFLGLSLVLFLGLLLLMGMFNLRQQVLGQKGEMSFQVYWESGSDLSGVKKQWQAIRKREGVLSITTYTPKQALESLGSSLGSGDLGWLESDNPLPPTALVRVDLPAESPEEAARELMADIEEGAGVDRISADSERLREAGTWSRISKRIFYPSLGGLVFLMAVIIANTFKLTLYTKQEEVEVLWLIGAGRWFIQLPILIGALIQALAATGLALGLLKATQHSLNSLLNTPPLWLRLHFLPLQHIAGLSGILLLVALLSSWVAIHRS